MRLYNHLSQKERQKIEFYLTNKISIREIARELNRTHSTILREINRNIINSIDKTNNIKDNNHLDNNYLWPYAQQKSENIRFKGNNKVNNNNDLKLYVIDKLNNKWSPEQISGRLKLENLKIYVSHKTIYSFIYNNSNKDLIKLLPNYNKKRYVNNHCIINKLKNLPSIDNRIHSDSITSWEADLIQFNKQTTNNVTTLFNRPSKLVRLIKNENAKTDTVLNGIYKHSQGIKILTMDRGIEFLRPLEIKSHNIEPFYCDAMCPWQKGGCENTNRRLRRWLPRNIDITKIKQEDLDIIAKEINNIPRKSIGYRTPAEFYESPSEWCTSR